MTTVPLLCASMIKNDPKKGFSHELPLLWFHQMYYLLWSTVHETGLTPTFTLNFYIKCLLRMYTSNVYFKCLLQMFTSNVYFKCLLQMFNSNFYYKCFCPKIILLDDAVLFHSTWKLPKQFLLYLQSFTWVIFLKCKKKMKISKRETICWRINQQ